MSCNNLTQLVCCSAVTVVKSVFCVCPRGMMSQITAREEQIAEYTERIAAMEEELKKVWVSWTPSEDLMLVCYVFQTSVVSVSMFKISLNSVGVMERLDKVTLHHRTKI